LQVKRLKGFVDDDQLAGWMRDASGNLLEEALVFAILPLVMPHQRAESMDRFLFARFLSVD
jgi:hypothetical protein